jgi:membrane protein
VTDLLEAAARRADTPRTRRLVAALGRVRQRARRDRVTIVAAGLSFYVLLSAIPALVATVVLFTWVRDAAGLLRRIEAWTVSFPDEIQRLLAGQLLEVAGSAGTGAGVGLAASLVGTLWASSRAGRALMQSLDIVHGIEPARHGPRRRGIAVAVAIAGLVTTVMVLSLVNAGSNQAGGWWETATNILFWPGLLLAVGAGAALAYRYAPSRPRVGLRQTLPGAVLTVLTFGVATVVVAVYVATIGVGDAYGSLGAVVAAGLWLLAVSAALLLGAYLNEELAEGAGAPAGRETGGPDAEAG